MKLLAPSVILPFLLTTGVNAWDLTVWLADGRHVTSHGTLDSGCVTYDFNMNSPVNRAVFDQSFFADTFELYEQANCAGQVSYRNGQGENDVTPGRIILSYKVY